MGSKQTWAYEPDYAIPPGETLEETLEAMGMTQRELAERTGRPTQIINGIIKGKHAITPETALLFERVLGIPANFWINLESQYQESRLRTQESKAFDQHTDWVHSFNYSELVRKNLVPAATTIGDKARNLMQFFGVGSPEQHACHYQELAVSFRKSEGLSCQTAALTAWLRAGEIAAAKISTEPYDRDAFLKVLEGIRPLTAQAPKDFIAEVKSRCAKVGVAVVWIPELDGCPVSGATRWLRPDRALIQLSLRFKSDDQVWFSFYHEAGHIALHGKREAFLDNGIPDCEKERDADHFARDILISPKSWESFVAQRAFSKEAIQTFAQSQNIAPSIVAGRLGHEKLLPWPAVNAMRLRVKFVWGSRT